MLWGTGSHRRGGDRGVPRGLLWGRSLGCGVLVFGLLPHSEKVEKTQPSIWEQAGKGSEELEFIFLPKTRVEQRSVNKIYPLN